MKVSDYLVKELEKITDSIFLVSGGGIMHLVDSVRKSKLNAYCCHHEQATTIAAEGYARMKNDIGVVLVTTGPGGTNAITGVAGAWLDSIPILVIAGQVKTDNIVPKGSGLRALGFQELNVIDLMKPITKYAVTVEEPYQIRRELEKAIRIAKEGRPGPVFLEIPLDVQAADLIPMELIVKKLKESENPLILIGNGVRLAGGIDILRKVIDKLKIHFVVGMFTASDILAPWGGFGVQGMWGNLTANRAVDNCDLLLVIGDRLDLTQTSYDYENFATQAYKIMVDIDPAVLRKKTLKIDLPVCCDAKEFLDELYKSL